MEGEGLIRRTGFCLRGLGLIEEAFDMDDYFIGGILRDAKSKIAARIGYVVPAKFLFADAADTNAGIRKREAFVGENCAVDQEIIKRSVFVRSGL